MKVFRLMFFAFLFLLLTIGSVSAKDNSKFAFTAYGGVDIMGKADQDSDYEELDGDEDISPGISLGIEGAMALDTSIYAGLGFQGRLPRDIDGDGYETGYSAIIPYLLFQFNIPDADQYTPYLIAHLGYNVPFADSSEGEDKLEEETIAVNPKFDVTGGVYFGFGGGFHFTEDVGMRIFYSVCYGENKFTADNVASDNMDVTITMLSLAVTYSF